MLAIIKLIDSKEGMEWVRQEWGREGGICGIKGNFKTLDTMRSDLLVIIFLSIWNGVHGRGACIEGVG